MKKERERNVRINARCIHAANLALNNALKKQLQGWTPPPKPDRFCVNINMIRFTESQGTFPENAKICVEWPTKHELE
jgi:hypothetical protein